MKDFENLSDYDVAMLAAIYIERRMRNDGWTKEQGVEDLRGGELSESILRQAANLANPNLRRIRGSFTA